MLIINLMVLKVFADDSFPRDFNEIKQLESFVEQKIMKQLNNALECSKAHQEDLKNDLKHH